MKHIFWTGYSKYERHSEILKLEQVISEYGAITDFKMFSDISIVLTIELPERNINLLYQRLKNILTLENFVPLPGSSDQDKTVLLNVTFKDATGNLRIEVPEVPG